MQKIAVEKCLRYSGGSVYKLTIMVAKRAQEIAEGSASLVEAVEKDKPLSIALRELAQGCLQNGENSIIQS
jgi:DNA-directed RNA polymerase omega subunit